MSAEFSGRIIEPSMHARSLDRLDPAFIGRCGSACQWKWWVRHSASARDLDLTRGLRCVDIVVIVLIQIGYRNIPVQFYPSFQTSGQRDIYFVFGSSPTHKITRE